MSCPWCLKVLVLFSVTVVNCQDDKQDENVEHTLNTEGCRIPDFSLTYRDLPATWGFTCPERQVEVFKSMDSLLKFKMLRPFHACCYRTHAYTGMKQGEVQPCLPFTNGMQVKLDADFISVGCNEKGKPNYSDRFAFVKKQPIKSTVNKKAYSVLMLGLHAVSRLRAYTQLPETVKYLQRHDWLDFKGYHEVSAETRANVLTVTTGSPSLPEPCQSLDACPPVMIWDRFKEAGYITGLGEDKVGGSMFYYENVSATHHYLNPFLKLTPKQPGATSMCSGKIQAGLQVLSYALDFARTYRERRSLGFFRIVSFAHDDDCNLQTADLALLNFFKELKRNGVLERSIVVFFADHGMRHGTVDQDAFPENRLPMHFMWVPYRFKKSYPKPYKSLVVNQGRLTTPYNLHLTVYSILKLSNNSVPPYKAAGCSQCTSLFRQIPPTQNCSTAGIGATICTCNAKIVPQLSEDASASLMEALVFLDHMVSTSRTLPCTVCQRYTFDKLYGVRELQYNGNSTVQLFLVTLRMQPATDFEVIVRKVIGDSKVNPPGGWNEAMIRKAVRQNEYKSIEFTTIAQSSIEHSWCVLDRLHSKICRCLWNKPECDNDDMINDLEKFIGTPINKHNEQSK